MERIETEVHCATSIMTQATRQPNCSPNPNQPSACGFIGKSFGGVRALDGVTPRRSCPVNFHAIMGEIGAGKSTLMKILSGVILEYEGDIFLDGELVRFAGKPPMAERAESVSSIKS